ncbi:acetyl-CoA carboxylase carboxyltransferase subunit [Myxococcota bacterium]|nr:acetyl-CoA carboxylase carboxyltransferase subunit [Myxococcota bacterium]
MGKKDQDQDSTALSGWGKLLSNLENRLSTARAMGGNEKLERQAARGEMNARQRIEALLDPDSFQELGTLVGAISEGAPADAFPAGFGRIEGRPVLVGAEDFSVKGGSIGLGAADKRFRLTQLALSEKVPLIFILQGAGHRITNALKGHGRTPNDLQGLVDLSGIVPTVCVVLGASAGHGALAAPLMDFVVMSEGAALFSAGPPLVEAAIGEKVEKSDLGGPAVHVERSGVAHNVAPDDASALAIARSYLGYLPSNAWEYAPPTTGSDTGERTLDEILEIVPSDDRRPYAMSRVIELLADQGSVLEVQPLFGRSLITALARLGGKSVAIVANNPSQKAGTFDRTAAEKGARFLEVMGGFHLPVIFLADNPGVMAGTAAEAEGALRAAARMFAAQHRLRGPKLHVTFRKAFGFGSSIMAMNPFDGQTLCVAFPGATLGAMPARGGGAAAHSDKTQQASLDMAESDGPYRIADTMGFDEIIDPRQLRNVLLRGLELTGPRQAKAAEPAPRFGALP